MTKLETPWDRFDALLTLRGTCKLQYIDQVVQSAAKNPNLKLRSIFRQVVYMRRALTRKREFS